MKVGNSTLQPNEYELKVCVSIVNFFNKLLKITFFQGKSENTYCPNFAHIYWFLRKLYHFGVYQFKRTLTRIYENDSRYLSEKSYNFELKVARALKFTHFVPNMMPIFVPNMKSQSLEAL